MENHIRKVAMYGKGGIGKTTVSANVSAALSYMGEKVMQVGCDPKRDSIATLCGGELMQTLLDHLRQQGSITEENIKDVIHIGFNQIHCVESGGPRPGSGCAGAGVLEALNLLQKYDIFNKYGITFALFDVLGDVVCGGFAQPMRAGYAKEVYIVTCGEVLTLFQINNIAKAVKRLTEEGVECGIAGLINNKRGLEFENEIVEDVAKLMGVPVVAHIPRSKTVQDAELMGQTVIESYPDSEQAQVYRDLAKRILENKETFIPTPLQSLDQLKEVLAKYY